MSGTPTRPGDAAETVLLCDCRGSMAPDADAIARATGLACAAGHSDLCRSEAGALRAALAAGPVRVACAQEARVFAETAEDLAAETGAEPALATVDIRDRAGWGEDPAGPKMAALVAESRLPPVLVPAMDVASEGVCLVYGTAEVVLPAAERLSAALTVTAMLTEPEPAEPSVAADIVTGRIMRVTGALGQFELEIDRFAELEPGGRGARPFGPLADGARSACDIVLDLSGGSALVPAAHKRDGYLRADPGDPLAVERALFDAAQLVGEFEKTLHVRLTEPLCAHSRARQTGCTRCLDICPTGAIAPDGDHVAVDPLVCAGCGACSAVCPTTAIASAEQPTEHLFLRMRTLAEAFRTAGGEAPRLLVHDDHGAEMIRLGARHGRGLPADVIPLEVPALTGFGHAEQAGALALGFAAVDILTAPRTERAALEAELALAEAILAGTDGAGRLRLLDETDPDALMERLHEAAPAPHGAEPILAAGGRRETVRLAARAFRGPEAGPAPLPVGAPYGAVVVNLDSCTLCLSCAGLCPTGALGDNPDRPELTFREEACIQCGLCEGLCPESAIQLVPQLDTSDTALRPRVVKEEEPFECISCGKLFGVKSTIERITEKLSSHALFKDSDNARLIQMCDDCRVRAQYHSESAPFRFGDRPATRTTDDYLRGSEDET